MKIHTLIILSFIVILGMTTGCGRKMPLPAVESNPESFGANDTSYTHINPIWTASVLGYNAPNPMAPMDLVIGADGYIFMADSANNRVVTLSPSGFVVTIQNLNKIAPVHAPTGLAIDAKLNLLMVNGSDTIFVWNQYINNIGVDSVIEEIVDNHYIFSANQARIDSLTGIHPFYIDGNPDTHFQGVAFGPSEDNVVFVTDNGNNRIIQLDIGYTGGVKLKNGFIHPTFGSAYAGDIVNYGSGAGTVDNPQQITTDENGNIYFTQFGGNFLVQKLEKGSDTYFSSYTLYEDPIMDLNRFQMPYDLALGGNDAIFVMDTGSGQVYKFFNKGTRAGQLAPLGKKGLVEAVFERALSVAVSDDEMVYVADTRNHQIRRFQFSVSEDDLPVEQP